MYRIELPKSLNLDCPACGAVIPTEIEFDADEDGTFGYCELEAWTCCGSDTCQAQLCEECRVDCYSCNLPVCEEHRRLIEGKPWCEICRKEAGLDCSEVAA